MILIFSSLLIVLVAGSNQAVVVNHQVGNNQSVTMPEAKKIEAWFPNMQQQQQEVPQMYHQQQPVQLPYQTLPTQPPQPPQPQPFFSDFYLPPASYPGKSTFPLDSYCFFFCWGWERLGILG